MIFEDLLTQLNHSNPQERIQALQILAMVEETRAINAILVIYKEDPDPHVREVAKWAGSAIWRAQEAGHTTEAALQQAQPHMEDQTIDGDDRVMRQLTPLAGKKTDKLAQEYDEIQAIIAQSEALYRERKPTKTDTQVMSNLLTAGEMDDLDLLDAGLIDFF